MQFCFHRGYTTFQKQLDIAIFIHYYSSQRKQFICYTVFSAVVHYTCLTIAQGHLKRKSLLQEPNQIPTTNKALLCQSKRVVGTICTLKLLNIYSNSDQLHSNKQKHTLGKLGDPCSCLENAGDTRKMQQYYSKTEGTRAKGL